MLKPLDHIRQLIDEAEHDLTKFYEKSNKAAGRRVRKNLQEIRKTAQEIRMEILKKIR